MLLQDVETGEIIGKITRYTTKDKSIFYVKIYDNDEWKTDEKELLDMGIKLIKGSDE